MITALALYSEGLDSLLAIKLMTEQSIQVKAIQFKTPFFDHDEEDITLAKKKYDIDLHQIDITSSFLKILKNPEHGYGRNLNPCIDCKILMLKEAKYLLDKFKASFIITGDVVGQRPMTQQKNTLRMIEKKSGLVDLIMRPLSAKILPITIPEQKGYIDRSLLLGLNGRSRKPQIALANKYNIKEYNSPAGGCLLTNPNFSEKLKILLQYLPCPDCNDLKLLSIGRHFYLSSSSRLIVGRDQGENQKILSYKDKANFILQVKGGPGPTSILIGDVDNQLIKLAASIMARYTKKTQNMMTEIQILGKDLTHISSIQISP